MTHTIEDILGSINEIDIIESDRPILKSILFQVTRGIGLTTGQHQLVKQKLLGYKDKIEELGIVDVEQSLDRLKFPIRLVDRSKVIEIVTPTDETIAERLPDKLIKIRFPFNKKTIQAVEELSKAHKPNYYHQRGSQCHYFSLNEITVEKIVKIFGARNFVIDPALLELADEISKIRAKKEDYLPGIFNNELKNLKPNAVKLIESEISELDPHYMLKLVDRARRYGLAHVADADTNVTDSLLGEIVHRDRIEIGVDSTIHTLSDLADVIQTLDRFPLLVVIDEAKALEQLKSIHEAFTNIDTSKQSALFRVKGSSDYSVNDYIKDHKLNNWVDKSTKIVYISKSKLPKLLLNSKWQPMCALVLPGHRSIPHIVKFVAHHSDLAIWLDSEHKLTSRKNYNGYM